MQNPIARRHNRREKYPEDQRTHGTSPDMAARNTATDTDCADDYHPETPYQHP